MPTGSTVFPSANDTNDLTSLKVPTGALQPGVTYYWTVSYTDSRGATSIPSAVTSFTTATVPMNQGGTSPLTMTVTDSSGHEITTLSDLAPAVANGTASGQLLTDLGASAVINSGALFDPSSQSPTVAIVKESGGSSNRRARHSDTCRDEYNHCDNDGPDRSVIQHPAARGLGFPQRPGIVRNHGGYRAQ